MEDRPSGLVHRLHHSDSQDLLPLLPGILNIFVESANGIPDPNWIYKQDLYLSVIAGWETQRNQVVSLVVHPIVDSDSSIAFEFAA